MTQRVQSGVQITRGALGIELTELIYLWGKINQTGVGGINQTGVHPILCKLVIRQRDISRIHP